MWLLIDDERTLDVDVIARTPEAGRRLLALGEWECLCMDHDLGYEESGYDIIKWAAQNHLLPMRVQLVTNNPVGRENIGALLRSCGYRSKDRVNYYYKPEAYAKPPSGEAPPLEAEAV